MRLARAVVDGRVVVVRHEGDEARVVGGDGPHPLVACLTGDLAPTDELIPLDRLDLLAPVDPPSFRDFFAFEAHVRNARMKMETPVLPAWYEAPIFYFSNPAGICGEGADIRVPRGCRALDYELEVACIIGTEASDLDPEDPATLDVVAGFVLLNDWSARDLQAREAAQSLGPAKGKDFATSVGAWASTPDELPDLRSGRPRAALQALVNGEVWSSGELADIHYSWPELLAMASADTTLRPGDLIGSGTVGTGCIIELRNLHGRDRHPWLRPGDVVELRGEGLGTLRNQVVEGSSLPAPGRTPAA